MEPAVYFSTVEFISPLYQSEESTARVLFGNHPAVSICNDIIDETTSFQEITMTVGEERIHDLVLYAPARGGHESA